MVPKPEAKDVVRWNRSVKAPFARKTMNMPNPCIAIVIATSSAPATLDLADTRHVLIIIPEYDEILYKSTRNLQPWIARHCRIPVADIRAYEIERRSLDARKKPQLKFVYQLAVRVRENAPVAEMPGVTVRTTPPVVRMVSSVV